ncbi:MAG: hypothetical protein C5B59_13350 [Bacteroidetes bacterium]|nr:MAG: hypothetical protein C5B59_13350 [Bacteroidota bacterium]
MKPPAMLSKPIKLDPRIFQAVFQTFFLCYGLVILNWKPEWIHFLMSLGGCVVFSYLVFAIQSGEWKMRLRNGGWRFWFLSSLISGLSLCLLLKTNHWYTSLLAGFLTVASKFIFKFGRKHIFNPSAFGIVATMIVTKDAWLSPGQWGANTVFFFLTITLGTIVVTRVQKLDTSLGFILAFVGLLYWRQIIILGWQPDYFIHSVSSGSLLLFSFFMISDPKTSPDHPAARIIWSVVMGIATFYLVAFFWIDNAAIWVLVFSAPLVPLFNQIFKSNSFEWRSSTVTIPFTSFFKKIIMKPFNKKIAALFILIVMISHDTFAFCGFYVSKADGTLKNKTSQVIVVHDGNRSVITMYNDFKGDPKDFAMVVPVPVVLKRSDIKVIEPGIFNLLNEYSKPRLVEYYDENPCNIRNEERNKLAPQAADVAVIGYGSAEKANKVTVEAKYLVGEYDILILSAKESSGLKDWLNENGYKIPNGAEEVLDPYIKSNLKFFVVKVNEKEKKKLSENFLRPIQISFNSPRFMLPIRLGMANAEGDQDMIVYAFTKSGRIECTNYRTVALPTGNKIPLFVQSNFANFYSNLFQYQWNKDGKSVAMVEYAWNVSPTNYVKCDPCVAIPPSDRDLQQAGVWWLKTRDWSDYSDVQNPSDYSDYSDNVYFTRLHIRYNREFFPQDLMFAETPNKENYQARYIITHPATGEFNCDAGRKYLNDLRQRRRAELDNLSSLTGKSYTDWDVVAKNSQEEKAMPDGATYASVNADIYSSDKKNNGILIATLGLVGLASVVSLRRQRNRN